MFKNPGAKLKSLAKVLFWFILVFSVLYAVNLCFFEPASGETGTLELITFFLLIVVSILSAWLSSIGLYAFGEMVENTHATREAVEKILKLEEDL